MKLGTLIEIVIYFFCIVVAAFCYYKLPGVFTAFWGGITVGISLCG